MALSEVPWFDQEEHDLFVQEASGWVNLLEAEYSAPHPDVERAFRAVHSLKGLAAMVGLTAWVDQAEGLEAYLAAVRFGSRAFRDSVRDYWTLVEAIRADLAHADAPSSAGRAEDILLAALWRRYPSMVDRLAAQLGKHIRLEVSGGEVRVPPRMAQALNASLLQLIRNACDHGIEPPMERRRQNKPCPGRLSLSATVAERHLAVRMQDDGRGFDWASVATPQPLEEVLLKLPPARPGAWAPSSVSGCGVGLDVVREETSALGGAVEVTSQRFRGTQFCLRFPLGFSPHH